MSVKFSSIRRRGGNSLCSLALLGVAMLFAMHGCKPSNGAPVAATAVGTVVPGKTNTEGFVLEDFLGRTWRNEAVRFPLSPKDVVHVQAKHALLGGDGKPVAYQLVAQGEGQPTQIDFLADLDPFQKRTYKFANTVASPPTDLKIEETATTIRMTNGLTGISIRKKLESHEGPIETIRLQSGKWVGGSVIDTRAQPISYSAKVVNNGPVFAEVECRVGYTDGGSWRINFRLNANEPVVLIDEDMALGDKLSTMRVNIGNNFQPNKLFYRHGNKATVADINPGNVFTLEPWRVWWSKPNQGQVFSVFSEKDSDLLSIGAADAELWVDPQIPAEQRARREVDATLDDSGLYLDFRLRNGRRSWIVSALDKEATLAVMNTPDVPFRSEPHQQVIKHGQFPLNVVKDYVLEWPSQKDVYPVLVVKKEDMPALQKNSPLAAKFAAEVERFQQGKLSQYALDGEVTPTVTYFMTGDEKVARNTADNAAHWVQYVVDMLLKQEEFTLGTSPHVQAAYIMPALGMSDVGLASQTLDPEKRQRLLSQIAFLGYAFNNPNFWSPERGYSGNPNMTTSVNNFRLMVASLIPSHPRAKEWAQTGVAELRHQLHNWSDENGGWLEAPHYGQYGFATLLTGLLMAHNAGLDDSLYSRRVKKIGEYFAKISTPKDSRLGGYRHLPAIGDTMLNESTGLFGALAMLWKDRDPAFAAQMQWMFEQHRPIPVRGSIGATKLFQGAGITPKVPQWGSEIFPKTGLVLRNHFPSDRETYLHLIHGPNHEHYDDDSGSIVMYAQGRVIADDFGYSGRGPEADHSVVSTPGAGGVMNVTDFATTENLDYVRGTKGPWTRQVQLVKSTGPQTPDYFVINDSLAAPAPFTWRLWLTAANVVLGTVATPPKAPAAAPLGEDSIATNAVMAAPTIASRALMVGREEVDMDVFVLSSGQTEFRTEKKTISSLAGYDVEGKFHNPMKSTQIGLISDVKEGNSLRVLLYPRLKTAPSPTVTTIAEGRGLKLENHGDIDYVFLADEPFTFKEGTISFSGKSGSVQIRGKKVTLSLGDGGTIAARGETLTADKAASKEVTAG